MKYTIFTDMTGHPPVFQVDSYELAKSFIEAHQREWLCGKILFEPAQSALRADTADPWELRLVRIRKIDWTDNTITVQLFDKEQTFDLSYWLKKLQPKVGDLLILSGWSSIPVGIFATLGENRGQVRMTGLCTKQLIGLRAAYRAVRVELGK